MAFDRDALKSQLSAQAAQGVFLGTSSWKYAGWRGSLYDESRYVRRGRFSEARFQKHCLGEYAEVFKTVCVDAAFYKFPEPGSLEEYASLVPADFLFALKVTDEITIRRFPNLPRFGGRAGQINPNFLQTDLFESAFLRACQPVRRNVALLIFEFSRFAPADFERGRDFVEALDLFLGKLPREWRYGVEIRNRTFLHPEYFNTLARHGVTHVYTSWQDMPSLGEQLDLPGSRTAPDFCGARLLLAPGRKYEEAVKRFSPYDQIKEVNQEGRAAARRLMRQIAAGGGCMQAFIYVNNRFEGNALATIAALLDEEADGNNS
jgi:uncharacterized protein YecE (DUF72 family)